MTYSVTMLLLMATAAIAQTVSLSSWERSISGTVTGAETGVPIVKRTVSVRGLNSGKEIAGETDMLGRYKVSHLLPGDYVVTVKGDDLVLTTANVTLTAEKDAAGDPGPVQGRQVSRYFDYFFTTVNVTCDAYCFE
jgi:Carboxypeptidase regulatory-like domain